MEFLNCTDPDIFAFPVNLLAGAFLIAGIYFLHRYYGENVCVRWLSSVQATLSVSLFLIFLLLLEGIWAIGLFRNWIFILSELLLLVILGLVILKRKISGTSRSVLFQLNHTGLWIALAASLLGAPDRETYKMIAGKGQPEYNCIDQKGRLHPLLFTVCLDKFELEYYPDGKMPKRFCSSLTLKSSGAEEKVRVEVNHPACFKGYRLYQDSYDTSRKHAPAYSVLLIVRDPWLGLVYTGIFMLLAGAVGLMIYGPVKKISL